MQCAVVDVEISRKWFMATITSSFC